MCVTPVLPLESYRSPEPSQLQRLQLHCDNDNVELGTNLAHRRRHKPSKMIHSELLKEANAKLACYCDLERPPPSHYLSKMPFLKKLSHLMRVLFVYLEQDEKVASAPLVAVESNS